MNNKSLLYVFIFMLLGAYSISEASGNYGIITKAMIDSWSDKIYSFKKANGIFPNTEDGLQLLCNRQIYDCIEKPKDTWKNELKYIYPAKYGTKEFDLYSFGENGIDDLGKKDDITNWSDLNTLYYYPARWIVTFFFVIIVLSTVLILMVKKSKGRKTERNGVRNGVNP